MCGIAGIISNQPNSFTQHEIKQMTNVIAHRGPDGEGQWVNEHNTVGLGHRRLSIIDLSHDGDQPMHYLNRYTIVFNGEIYNYLELKKTLQKQGYQFRSVSDTEVLLALYDRDKENCLALLDGMFSFALYDKLEQTVFCARDRFGEKPFFYSTSDSGTFIFGSELKELWAAGVKKEANFKMAYNFLAYGLEADENHPSHTFYQNCYRLPPSHYIKISIQEMNVELKQYYHIPKEKEINLGITATEAIEHVTELLTTSVNRRLRSDVSVGSSLSGGLDSSIIVSIINGLKDSEHQQHTFSAIFPGYEKNEEQYIKEVLKQCENAHGHYIEPNEELFVKYFNKLCYHQEEPFGSSSIFAQYCVQSLAQKENTIVLLDGQGADEIAGGYHSFYPYYFKSLKKSNKRRYQDEMKAYIEKYGDELFQTGISKEMFRRSTNYNLIFLRRVKEWQRQFKDNFYTKEFFRAHFKNSIDYRNNFRSLNDIMTYQTTQYGLEILLKYSDRNSMAHSREVRLPFLYHELVDYLFQLPDHLKINQAWTKWILRKSFEKQLPKSIIWRKDKVAYEPPQKVWMENADVVDMIHHAKEVLVKQQILNPKQLDKKVIGEQALTGDNKNWKTLALANTVFSKD